VIDTHGGCEPADLFLMIPNDYRGDDIIKRVTAEMPGVSLKEWKFRGYSMTAAQADKRLEDSTEVAIRRWLSELPSGKTPANGLWDDGIVSRKQFNKHWKKRILDPQDALGLFLKELGIKIERRGLNTSERIIFYLPDQKDIGAEPEISVDEQVKARVSAEAENASE
jgi:hypothetical protein